MATDKKRPVYEKKAWPLSVVVFEHPVKDGDGVNHSVRVTKSFKRGEEAEFENTEWLGTDDLLAASQLYVAAWQFIQSRNQTRYQRSREDRQTAGAGQF